MTALALLAAQAALHALIQTHAIDLGHDPAKIAPIYDGVVDAEAYLAAKPKIMWILKEPYDDFDAEGMPAGGGWTICKDWYSHHRLRDGDAPMHEPGPWT